MVCPVTQACSDFANRLEKNLMLSWDFYLLEARLCFQNFAQEQL